MVGGGDFIEIMGLALGGSEIGGKFGGGGHFGEGFACGGIRVKKMKSECRHHHHVHTRQ